MPDTTETTLKAKAFKVKALTTKEKKASDAILELLTRKAEATAAPGICAEVLDLAKAYSALHHGVIGRISAEIAANDATEKARGEIA